MEDFIFAQSVFPESCRKIIEPFMIKKINNFSDSFLINKSIVESGEDNKSLEKGKEFYCVSFYKDLFNENFKLLSGLNIGNNQQNKNIPHNLFQQDRIHNNF